VSHVLHCGDCLEGLATLPAQSVDLVVTDPPYAVSDIGMWHIGRPGKGKRRFDFFPGDADHAAIVALAVEAAKATLRAMKPLASAYWWCGHREFGPLIELFEGAGFKTRFLVWSKAAPSPPPPGSGWPSGAELCVYAFKPGRTWTHDGVNPPPRSNVLVCDSFRHGQPGKAEHPTQKPLRVVEPLIVASSRPGDLVLDPFAGSGTTLVAAKRLGRNAIGWEKDPKFHAAAVKRLDAAREQFQLPRMSRPKQLQLEGPEKDSAA
jgi:DNA modification methylase